MCLAHPAQILALHDNDMATVQLGETRVDISLALIEEAGVGDYVLVHVGYALNRLSEDKARQTLELMSRAGLGEQS